MAAVEKISIALTADMLAMVREAVRSGDYASSSEVVRDALRQWKVGRALQAARHPPDEGLHPEIRTESTSHTADGLLAAHRQALSELCQRFAVRHLGLFGSMLRTDFDPSHSDIDLVVEFGDTAHCSPARQYFDFKAALEQLLGYPVDLVELTSLPPSRLRRIIERTQVPLYAQAA